MNTGLWWNRAARQAARVNNRRHTGQASGLDEKVKPVGMPWRICWKAALRPGSLSCLVRPSAGATVARGERARRRVERVREFGQVYLALSLWRRLGLHRLLNELIPSGRERSSLGTNACLLTSPVLCASERTGHCRTLVSAHGAGGFAGVSWRRSMTTGCTADWTRFTAQGATDQHLLQRYRAGLVWASSS